MENRPAPAPILTQEDILSRIPVIHDPLDTRADLPPVPEPAPVGSTEPAPADPPEPSPPTPVPAPSPTPAPAPPTPPAPADPSAPEAGTSSREEEPLVVAMVDDTVGLRNRARDLADARLASETQAGGGFRGFVSRVWKGSVANEYYRQKYYHQAVDNLLENDSAFGADRRAARIQTVNVVDRFISEYEQETVHREAGERKVVLDDSAEGQQIKEAVKGLIREFAQGNIDDEGFQAERLRVLDELSANNPGLMGEGLLYADNLLDIAEQVRARAETGAALDDTLERMQFVVGEARTGVRTEAQLNRADKLVQRLHDTKYGSMVNESTIGAAVGAGLAISQQLTRKTVGAALAIPGLTGLSTGIFAGLRESKRLKQERAQHGREMAQGGELRSQSPRRERMEQFRVTTISAMDLGRGIEQYLGIENETILVTSNEQASNLLLALSEASSRTILSDQQGIDFIHYSDVTAVEGERTYLDIAIGRAKVALRHFAEDNPDSELALNGGVDAVLGDMLAAYRTVKDRDVASLDSEFASFRRKTAIRAAVVGTAVGAAFGFAIQEGVAHMPGLGHGAGIGETAKPGEHMTLLGGLGLGDQAKEAAASAKGVPGVSHNVNDHLGLKIPEGWKMESKGGHVKILDNEGHLQRTLNLDKDGTLNAKSIADLKDSGDKFSHSDGLSPKGENIEIVPGSNNKLALPEGYTLKNIDAATSVITDPTGKTINLELNPDGSLSANALAQLKEAGFISSHQTMVVDGLPVDQQTNGNGLVFVNGEQTRFIHRTDWYDNKTPSVFDKNELKAWAGGQNGGWYDADGNVVIDVSHMTPNGSYNNLNSVDPFAASAANNLHLGISVTKETQAHVFDFKFQTTADGRTIAVIPKDSPVHQLFQQDTQGNRVYNGKYFEVLEDTNTTAANGAANVRPLATYVGKENGAPFVTKVPTTETHTITSLSRGPQDIVEILASKPNVEGGNPIDTFPIIPLRSRAGLEKLRQREDYYGYDSYYYDSEELRAFRREISPRLRDNPEAELESARELAWYREEIERRRGRRYLNRVDSAINDSPELLSLPTSTRAVVVIPVRGSAESENIENVLSLYAQQDDESLADTTVLLNVNFTDTEMASPEEVAKINATYAAIESAKSRFPQLKVAVIKQELKTAEITGRGKGAIGEVARLTYDTAMMAVEKAMSSGTIPPNRDVLLIRKDADELGMSRIFLKSYLEKANKQVETDVFGSNFRLQTDMHRRFPGLALVHRFETSLEAANLRVAESHGELHHAKTRGVAIGVRMATLAGVGSIGFGDYTGAGSDDLSVGKRVFAARRGMPANSGRLGYSRSHSRRGRTGSVRPGVPAPNSRRVIDRVPSAEIDTHAGRLVSRYSTGRPIIDSWSDFSTGGGYRPRNAGVTSTADVIERDDVLGDPAGVASRVAMQISASSSHPSTDRVAVSMALNRLFAKNRTSNGEPIYTVNWSGGECNFNFTDSGVTWLQEYLSRDLSGRYDSLGARTRRKLYGEAGGARPPRRAESLMVKAV